MRLVDRVGAIVELRDVRVEAPNEGMDRYSRTPPPDPSDAADGARASACLEPSPVLTVDELAALLRLDRKTVYAMVNRGEIPGVRRFGRTVRIHRDTVLRWLADGQGQAPRPRRRP